MNSTQGLTKRTTVWCCIPPGAKGNLCMVWEVQHEFEDLKLGWMHLLRMWKGHTLLKCLLPVAVWLLKASLRAGFQDGESLRLLSSRLLLKAAFNLATPKFRLHPSWSLFGHSLNWQQKKKINKKSPRTWQQDGKEWRQLIHLRAAQSHQPTWLWLCGMWLKTHTNTGYAG